MLCGFSPSDWKRPHNFSVSKKFAFVFQAGVGLQSGWNRRLCDPRLPAGRQARRRSCPGATRWCHGNLLFSHAHELSAPFPPDLSILSFPVLFLLSPAASLLIGFCPASSGCRCSHNHPGISLPACFSSADAELTVWPLLVIWLRMENILCFCCCKKTIHSCRIIQRRRTGALVDQK